MILMVQIKRHREGRGREIIRQTDSQRQRERDRVREVDRAQKGQVRR